MKEKPEIFLWLIHIGNKKYFAEFKIDLVQISEICPKCKHRLTAEYGIHFNIVSKSKTLITETEIERVKFFVNTLLATNSKICVDCLGSRINA